jgi:hypothetical protein
VREVLGYFGNQDAAVNSKILRFGFLESRWVFGLKTFI